jgi:hypothetical protein
VVSMDHPSQWLFTGGVWGVFTINPNSYLTKKKSRSTRYRLFCNY